MLLLLLYAQTRGFVPAEILSVATPISTSISLAMPIATTVSVTTTISNSLDVLLPVLG